MSIEQLQKWLNSQGFGNLKVDGIIGDKTKAALRKAQSYLQNLGLYKGKIDGKIGDLTKTAIDTFKKGAASLSKYGVSWNMYDKNSISKALDSLKKKGIKKVIIGNTTVDVSSNNALSQFMHGVQERLSGQVSRVKQQVSKGNSEGNRNWLQRAWDKGKQIAGEVIGNTFGEAKEAIAGPTSTAGEIISLVTTDAGTRKPGPTGASSYKEGDLDHLVERYAYDKYHGNDIDDKEWGISYNYNPTSTATNYGRIPLKISNKYTEEEAERIARSAGIQNYVYDGKKKKVNLFGSGSDSKYKDEKEFENAIQTAINMGDLEGAQTVYNEELARQYNNFGIDYNMLTDKTGFQWNNLFGVIPYGYNEESIKAILTGKQAVEMERPQGADPHGSGSHTTMASTYAWDPETGKGRVDDTNFDTWYSSVTGKTTPGKVGISPTRAAASRYQAGFALVDPALRKEFTFMGAKADPNNIDRTNYYWMTNNQKGSGQMKAWIYDLVSKNPEASYAYFRSLFDNGKGGIRSRSDKFNLEEADKLARAAGLPSYHRYTSDKNNANWIEANNTFGIPPHDMYESLRSFYENGFDDYGKLKSDFKYAENGYDHYYDGGNNVVSIKNGKWANSQDDWNVNLGKHNLRMSANNGRGVPLLARAAKKGGKIFYFKDNQGRFRYFS